VLPTTWRVSMSAGFVVWAMAGRHSDSATKPRKKKGTPKGTLNRCEQNT